MNDDPSHADSPRPSARHRIGSQAPTEPNYPDGPPWLNSPSRRAARGSTMSMPPIPARRSHKETSTTIATEASQDRPRLYGCATARSSCCGDV